MADVKATQKALALVEEFIKGNPTHPAAQEVLKRMAGAGPLGNIRARQLSEQAMGRQIQPPGPMQVNPITKAKRRK